MIKTCLYRIFFVLGGRLEGFLLGGKSQIGWLRIRQEYAHHESSEIYPDIPCSVVLHGNGHATETCIWVMAVAIFVGMPRERE